MCPYIDRQSPRCCGKLTLSNLGEALTRCAQQHQQCPIYCELQIHARKRPPQDRSRLAG
jgi:hypothetical protein